MGPKNVNKSKSVRKTVLMNPLSIKWPEINEDDEIKIKDELKRIANQVPNDIKIGSSKFKKKTIEGIVLGVNEVTKHLEKDKLRAVIVCPTGKAPQLNEHLISICEIKNIPIIALKKQTQVLPNIFGLKSVLALGISKSNQNQDEFLSLIKYTEEISSKIGLGKNTIDRKSDLKKIPPPPKIEFHETEKQVVPLVKPNSESMDFISVSSSLAFPKPDYPLELDSLVIKIMNPSIQLHPGNKRKAENEPEIESSPKLLDLNLKTSIHTPSGKKREKKLLKKSKKMRVLS